VKASPAAQLALLDLQGLDSEIAQLLHRRRTLPALATLAELGRRGEQVHMRVVELQTAVGDIAKEQARLEADIDVVRQREVRNQQRLQLGGIPAKELSGLEHELTTLKRRQGTLEDEALEIMEQRESIEAELAVAQAEEAEVTQKRDAATVERDDAIAGIDATVIERRQERAPLAATIPADLLALYDKIRAGHDGVGAAALTKRRCQGCHIELAGSELNAARDAADDDVLRCDNCRRILIRTADSDL
jgi:uncharacterized protein